MEDRHIKLTQIGRVNKKDENGFFSAGWSYINPNNILFLEEVRDIEKMSYQELLKEYEKDSELKRICWWAFTPQWNGSKEINTIEEYVKFWKAKIEREKEETSSYYNSEACVVRHTKVNLITGNSFLAKETPEEIRDKINEFYKREAESNENKIVVTKEDIVKNFIFKNFT